MVGRCAECGESDSGATLWAGSHGGGTVVSSCPPEGTLCATIKHGLLGGRGGLPSGAQSLRSMLLPPALLNTETADS